MSKLRAHRRKQTMSPQKIEKFWGGEVEEGRRWSVQIVKAESLPSVAEVTAVAIVARLNDKILFIRNKRGWDIPGGHVEKGDETIEQAARRELLEEACVQGREFRLVGYLVSDLYLDKETYIPILLTEVTALRKFDPRHETEKRRLMTLEECKEFYYGNPLLIEELLRVALGKE